jgi:hypothetical protein
VKRRDGEERPDADLELPLPLGEVVQYRHAMPRPRQGHRRGPAEIAVAAEHEDPLSHVRMSLRVRLVSPSPPLSGSAGV